MSKVSWFACSVKLVKGLECTSCLELGDIYLSDSKVINGKYLNKVFNIILENQEGIINAMWIDSTRQRSIATQ